MFDQKYQLGMKFPEILNADSLVTKVGGIFFSIYLEKLLPKKAKIYSFAGLSLFQISRISRM